MAVFKVELDQANYEKLVTLALDEERPPSWHITWLIKKAIQQAYAEAYPAPGQAEASTTAAPVAPTTNAPGRP